MIQRMRVAFLKPNPNNPRIIKDDKFYKLVESIKNFPEMLEARPIVVNQDLIVLGGNMRLKALIEANVKEAPVEVVQWDEDKQRQFIIKDNVGFGEWDWNELANTWDAVELESWGLDIPKFDDLETEAENDEDDKYTKKVDAPIYEPSNEKPSYKELYDKNKFDQLIKKIDSSAINKEDKDFLKSAATRHIVFDYQKIADYYAHSDKETQELMEESALVIIDFNKAVEYGYVKLSEQILDQYIQEYDEE